jgi:hypothetical protein
VLIALLADALNKSQSTAAQPKRIVQPSAAGFARQGSAVSSETPPATIDRPLFS